jgi:hypothetical protein
MPGGSTEMDPDAVYGLALGELSKAMDEVG